MSSDALVHVIDDDEAIRQSLDFLLRSARIGVRTYESAAAFLDVLPSIRSGCIVTDVRMPGVTGIDLLRRLRDLKIAIPIIVITGHGDVPLAIDAMKLGAVDFLEKPFDDDILLAAIRSALVRWEKDGQRETERAELHERLATLTSREREVLDGLVAGNPSKAIAFDLGISPRTVEISRANVMTKMKAASLSELVRMALAGGFLDTSIFKSG